MAGWVLAVCVGLLLWFSQECLAAARAAAAVFATGVMPALFPMMVLAGLPWGRGAAGQGGWREKAGAVLFAFSAGSPAGARRVAALPGPSAHATGPLFVAAGVMSPLFFLGSMAGWTGSKGAMGVLLGVHWLGALVAGAMAWGMKSRRERKGRGGRPPPPFPLAYPAPVIPMQPPIQDPEAPPGDPACVNQSPSLWASLPGAIASGARALLSVCGAMMLFGVVAAVLRELLLRLWPGGGEAGALPQALLHALLEVGGGAYALVEAAQESGIPSQVLYPLLCGACSFGGLSIWLQNLAYTGQSIRPGTLLLYRAVHGALSFGLCWAVFQIWPPAAPAAALGANAPGFTPGVLFQGWIPLALLMALAFWKRRSKTCSPRS